MMNTGLTNEQMKMFVEIIQMVALLDESMQKYISEFYSLCSDEQEIKKIQNNTQGLESMCKEISKILEKNTAINKPRIEKMTGKYHSIKEIRNYIAHDRRLLVITGLNNIFMNGDNDFDLPLERKNSKIRDMSIEELYAKACEIFKNFQDFLGQLYFNPQEEEYRAERRNNLYGK